MFRLRRKWIVSGYAKSDKGRQRQRNEDTVALVTDPNSDDRTCETLAIVADGMGGHQGGEIASSMACQIMQSAAGDLTARMQQANRQILLAGGENPMLHGMGSTCTALLTRGRKATIAHVGDSRAYLFRSGLLTQLTVDDTLATMLQEEGDTVKIDSQHILTKALGMQGLGEIQSLQVKLRLEDRILLCSDGLYNELSKDELAIALVRHRKPQSAVDHLIGEALIKGGSDNISAIVLNVNPLNK